MKYKLVAMDLDGTLLDSNKILADSTLRTIRQAQDKGVIFTIATGRMFRGAVRYAQQLDIDVPIITYNGAVIKHPASDEMARLYKVPAISAVEAINVLQEKPALRYVFMDDDVYTDTPHQWTDQYAGILEVDMRFVADVRDILEEDPIMVVFMVDATERNSLTAGLKNRFNSDVRITNSSDWFIDVLHPQASKSLALSQLAQTLGITREEIIAIGDNSNDLEMIEYAGLGVAVANASEDLKRAADVITENEIYSGVEEIIEQFVLK